jgi:twitching motility protein PilT
MHPQDRLFCEIAVQLELLTRDQVVECQREQQGVAKGRNIAAITTAMGFLSQSEAELVLSHQQRVLDRRREARAASQDRREIEARAAVSRKVVSQRAAEPSPVTQPNPHQHQARRGRKAEPTPTSQWLPAQAEPTLAAAHAASVRSQQALRSDKPRTAQAHETLDARPQAARRATPPPASAYSESVRSGAQPARAVGPTGTQLGPPPIDFQALNAAAAPSPRPRLPTPRPAHAAGETAPSGSVAPTQPRSAFAKGTLLGASGFAARQAEAAAVASAPKPRARPVPQGRDWRNPSRPPPMAASDRDPPVGRLAHAETLILPANDAQPNRLKLPSADARRYLDAAVAVAVENGASDLHVHSGAAPHMRIDGKLWPMASDAVLPREAVERVIAELLDEAQWMQLMVDGDLRFAHESLDGVRCRAHAYCQERGTDIVMRLLPKQIPAPEKLGLSMALRYLPEHAAGGLCVCSGPAGSGKTTTLASMTQALTSARALHVVTLESPIEFVHGAGLGLIEQREVGTHVASLATGIDLAQRQGANLIVVSDLAAPGVIEACLRAVRAGCLVLGSLRASSSGQALGKLLRAFDPANAERQRAELAYALRLLLHQRLLPRAKTPGRVAAFESVVNSAQVAQLIREDKLQQLPAMLAAGKGTGTLSLDEALEELVRAGTIDAEAARREAHRRERFRTP